jgi:hypothetical protein
MPSLSSTAIPAARVEAETAPNRPAVAMPSISDTPRQRASVARPIRMMTMPTTAARIAGTASSIRFASRTEMPADRPTFSSSRMTMNL